MKLKNKFLAILLVGIACFSISTFPVHATQTSEDITEEETDEITDYTQLPVESNEINGWPAGPIVSSESAIIMDAGTGTILYSKNIDAREYPASITKIMTVLLALENSSLDETVTFSRNAVFSIERNSSHIARTDGEELTMEQCLYAIMLESANECANAVAEHIAGSVEAFADMMNQRAAELGCTNTHFVNPHGLHNADHYTSAHDMALITRAALQNDKFREIAGTVRYTIPPTNKNNQELVMNNHHCMISKNRTSKYFDDTVFAGKTGFTTDALNTLVTCSSRNGMDIICVLMRAPSATPYPDTQALLTYASDNFSAFPLPETIEELPDSTRTEISGKLKGFDISEISQTEHAPASVILPNNVSFESLHPSVTISQPEESLVQADITYSYENVPVGTVSYQFHAPSAIPAGTDSISAQAAPQNEAASKDAKAPGKLLGIIKYVIIGIVSVIIVLLLAAMFFTIRIQHTNRKRRRRRRKSARQKRMTSNVKRKRREETYDLDDFLQLEEFNDFDF